MGQSLDWRNHQQYLGCVYRHANAFFYAGRIGYRERNRLLAEALRSELRRAVGGVAAARARLRRPPRGLGSHRHSSGSRFGGRHD